MLFDSTNFLELSPYIIIIMIYFAFFFVTLQLLINVVLVVVMVGGVDQSAGVAHLFKTKKKWF